MRARVAVALCLALPSVASASPAVEGRFFFEEGEARYRAGRYAEAAEAFLLSYERAPSPGAMFNAALASRRARRAEDAYAFMQAYLRHEDPDPARRERAEAILAELRRTLAVVRVESEPPGATIYVDRDELGAFGATPRDVVVSPGAHVIRLERPDHEAARVEVEAVVGERRRVRATLAHRTGTLRLEGTPRGGPVIVERDGAEVARGALGRTIELPVGHYRLRVVVDGYTAPTAEVHVRAAREETRALLAEPIPAPVGRALVSTGRVRARVTVDGHAVGETPAVIEALPVGEHALRLEADGYLPWTGRRRVEDGATTYVSVDLVEAP